MTSCSIQEHIQQGRIMYMWRRGEEMGKVEWLGSQVRFTDLPVPSFWEETDPILGGSGKV